VQLLSSMNIVPADCCNLHMFEICYFVSRLHPFKLIVFARVLEIVAHHHY
jgi:hypothetical protein